MSEDAAIRCAEAYRRAIVQAGGGKLTEFSLTHYDRTGIPVVATVWDDGRSDAHGVGYGWTPAVATRGAFGELAERMLLAPAVAALPRRRASYAELRQELGAQLVVDPVTLVLEAGSPYTPERQLDWVPVLRWRTGEQVLVPVEFVAFDEVSLPPDPPPGGWLTTAITNGLGAGDTLERAVGHGLLELVQRDGDTVSFRALDQGAVLDLTAADPSVTDLVASFATVGIEAVVKLASTEFACVVYCVGRDDDERTPPMALGAVGEAAHPDRNVAVAKALLEFASSRARRVFAFGPLERVAELDPDYLAGELERPLGVQEPRALEAMSEWSQWDGARMREVLAPSFFRRDRVVELADLPTAPDLSEMELLDTLLDRLAGFDVLVAAGGEPGGMRAVKVLAPGLEVETLSYQRIGERTAATLLARGSDLVGRGRADRPSRLPVHLTADATERIGGPVWLDRAAVQRSLGQLYPLYREPRRHAVDRANASRRGCAGDAVSR
jgi:YcaO-like protein with predicted kinase domain